MHLKPSYLPNKKNYQKSGKQNKEIHTPKKNAPNLIDVRNYVQRHLRHFSRSLGYQNYTPTY